VFALIGKLDEHAGYDVVGQKIMRWHLGETGFISLPERYVLKKGKSYYTLRWGYFGYGTWGVVVFYINALVVRRNSTKASMPSLTPSRSEALLRILL